VSDNLATRLLSGDAALFEGKSAKHALGWLRHTERYLGPWLDDMDANRPRRYGRTLLLGMGGSSSPARLYAESRPGNALAVLDTSNPDTIAATEFAEATVIAASKSGTTVETQALLAHALAHGLDPVDLIVITDPGTSLAELATALGAFLVYADPDTPGRFSGLSPYGLVPAFYAGWTPATLREELAACELTHDLVARAIEEAGAAANDVVDGWAFYGLGGDPITSGGALWLEQLVAETTGKSGRGFIPRVGPPASGGRPGDMQRHHLVSVLLARGLGVNPFDQPDVDGAKRAVLMLLSGDEAFDEAPADPAATRAALAASRYNAIQAFAPLEAAADVAALRRGVEERYGPTTANLGPRYLHSTGQLHKGGPDGVAALQIIVRPRSAPERIVGRRYSFHELHLAQARADARAMRERQRFVAQLFVDDVAEAAQLLELQP